MRGRRQAGSDDDAHVDGLLFDEREGATARPVMPLNGVADADDAGGGVISKYSVAIVMLSLIAGGAIGIVYENARYGGGGVEVVAEAGAGAVPEAEAAEAVAPTGRAEDAGPEVRDESEGAPGAPSARAGRRASVARGLAERRVRAYSRPAAPRVYVSVSRREGAGGGRSVAGHMAGGVKKTGAVIAKPFVKVGDLFHD